MDKKEILEEKKTVNMTELWRLYAQTFGCTYIEARQFCEQFIDLLAYIILEKNQDVVMHRVGGFKHFHQAERKVRHPKTGEPVVVKAHDLIRFVKSPEYKEFWMKYSYGTKNNCEFMKEDGQNDCL